MKVLITADPIESLLLEMDTSITLSSALLERGVELDWCVLEDQQFTNPKYLSNLKVRALTKVTSEGVKLIPTLSAFKTVNALDYDVIFHRKDPPINDFYIKHHEKFLSLPGKILQINHPKATLKYSEHELPQEFSDFAIHTVTINNFSQLQEFSKNEKYKIVLKPHNTSSGIGIIFVFSEEELNKNKARIEAAYPWIAQPFIPNIEKLGDLRVLFFNGRHLGQILRLPAKGSLLANIHQGGSVVAAELTPTQAKASLVVADTLLSKGVYFIGIDFLGDKISEVNITSPMGLRELNRLNGIQSHLMLVDELLKIKV